MSTINGRVVVKETNAGVPDLLIVVFDAEAVPDEILRQDECGGQPEIWRRMPGDRLGSVLTDERGRFMMDYEVTAREASGKERRPSLVLLVVAPEDPSAGPCPRVLHVSCGSRIQAARAESYLIKLPFELLREAGIDAEEPRLASPRAAARELLSRLKAASVEQGEPSSPKKPFSERYKEQRDLRPQDESRPPPRPPKSLGLTLPVRFTGKASLSAEATLSFKKETGRFHLQLDPEEPAVPLTFTGVSYGAGRDGDPVAGGIGFLVDPAARELRLSLPRSSSSLVAVQSSALFERYREQLRTADAARAVVAAPAGPPSAEDEHA